MIRKIFCLVLAVSLYSCNLLEKEPLGELSVSSAYVTENDAFQALTAAYNPLINYLGISGYSIYDIAADNAEKGGEGPSDGAYINEIAYFTLTATNTIASQVWARSYLGVHRANLVIDNVVGIDMDEQKKTRIIAEAHFLRGYYYSVLVTLFGDVPLITRSDENRQELERTAKKEVYDLIIEDFKYAAEVLPAKSQFEPSERGRATKGAAMAYLGKIYLYKRDFQEAEVWMKRVIDNGEYSLEPDYYRMFTKATEFGTENIFEINYVYDARHEGVANPNCLRQGSAGMYGYGFANPTQDLVDEFEPGDPRLSHTVYKNGDTMPDGKIADVGNSETGYMSKKAYLSEEDFPATGDAKNSDKNEVVYRYAMLLLWYAEAANENGHTQEALNALNSVRERAREGNDALLPDVVLTDQDALRKAIWHEQRVEYAMENIRYFDLLRQNRLGEVMTAYSERYNSNKGKNFRNGVNELFPIPQTEIDLSQDILRQNKGY